MTALPTVSVVVVSWQRPDHLRRCLLALQQQDHPALELCLVVDPGFAETALPALRAAGLTGKVAANPGDNISAARNIGLGLARGEVVAFIDDDAVAEPTWASRLAQALADPSVVAATGHTIGRNGISLQWGAAEVDRTGHDHPLPHTKATTLHRGSADRAVKPVGTNCAFRREALLAVGGFDTAYRFYLEDADIGLRLSRLGQTAVVPGAVVHHAFAPSARRRQDRVPSDLTQIGASVQVFLRRHAPAGDWPSVIERLRVEQSARVAAHLAARRIDRAEAARLLQTLEEGLAEGADRPLPVLAPLDPVPAGMGFLALPGTGPRPGRMLAGRLWNKARLERAARQAVQAREIVTLLCLSPTLRAHRMQFTDDGFWLQTGGVFGRADRSTPRFRLSTLGRRLQQETSRLSEVRPTSPG